MVGCAAVCSRGNKSAGQRLNEFFRSQGRTIMSTAVNEHEPIPHAADDQEMLELESKYCSWGDTVHYLDPPKFFERAEGHYLFDREGTPYLDLQMWYSASSFGYGNQRLIEALRNQLDKLPQLACQYLHSEKV